MSKEAIENGEAKAEPSEGDNGADFIRLEIAQTIADRTAEQMRAAEEDLANLADECERILDLAGLLEYMDRIDFEAIRAEWEKVAPPATAPQTADEAMAELSKLGGHTNGVAEPPDAA